MDPSGRDRADRPLPHAGSTLGTKTRAQAAPQKVTGEEPQAVPDGGGSSWAVGWLRRAARWPATRQIALLLAFVAAGIGVTWPVATYITGSLPSSRDTASYVWGFWWVARQMTHLGNPWFTHLMAAPVGVQLGFHTLMPLPAVLLTPVTLLFGPSATYNLLVMVIPGLLCYAMYRAARLWLRSGIAAVAAGVFFGLSSMLTQQDWYHVNIAFGALFLPLALEASVRLRRRPGLRQGLVLGLVMGAAVLTDQESSVLAAIVTALTLVPWLVRQPGKAKLWTAGLAVLTGTVIASPQIVAMVQEIQVGHLAIDPHTLAVSYKQYGIGLPGMFTPTPRWGELGMSALSGPFLHGRDNEGLPMFGTLLTVLALVGLVVARKRRSAWLLATLWVGCAALALGPSLWIGRHQYLPLATMWHGVRVSSLMPYTWFVRIPGLSSFREADRLAILGLMPAALLAGAAVEWLRWHAKPLIALAAALAVLETGYSGSPRVGTMPTSYPVVDSQIKAGPPGSIVVDIPFGLRGGIPVYGVPFFPKALVMATADGHPRSIAYISRVPTPTIAAINAHAFYRNLVSVQHEIPRVCPWMAGILGCYRPKGVIPTGAIKIPPAQIAAARKDATRMHIGWAVVWKRNISVDQFIRYYLLYTGFRFSYRDGNILVYKHTG